MEERYRIYFAAPWKDKNEMDERVKPFMDAGFAVTHKWWRTEESNYETDHDVPPERLRAHAEADVMGVCTADVLVVFNTGKSEGKAVEQGIALGRDIPIVAIGTRGEHSVNVFHYLDFYNWVADTQEAIWKVKELMNERE